MKHSKKKNYYSNYYIAVIYMFFFANLVQLNASTDFQVIHCDNKYINQSQQQCDLQQVNQSINQNLIIQSNILLQNKVLAGGSVVISDGKIIDIICANHDENSPYLLPGFSSSHDLSSSQDNFSSSRDTFSSSRDAFSSSRDTFSSSRGLTAGSRSDVGKNLDPAVKPRDDGIGQSDDIDLLERDSNSQVTISSYSKYQNYNKLSCTNTVLSPGFINPHEHIGHSYVPTKTINKLYKHRDDWRFNKDNEDIINWPKELNNLDNLNWIELRHLLSGTITVASAPPFGNIVKHFDNYFMKTMPFGHDTVKAFGDPLGLKCSLDKTACPTPFISSIKDNVPHVGEGIDSLANVEIKSYIRNILDNKNSMDVCEFCDKNKFSFVHGVAADLNDLQIMSENNISLIWSLTSNLRLYGKTARIIDFYNLGGNIAISTDWSASGSLNMLEEIAAVIKFNQEQLNNFFSDYQLWQMVTINGAKALGIDRKTGEFKPGLAADMILVPYKNNNFFKSILENNPEDIIAIWRDGVLQAANSDFVDNDKLNIQDICNQKISSNNYLCLSADKFDFIKLQELNKQYLAVL